ncbi:ABC transporter ATP-binding protein [Quadrisphaera sp. GCM10027208]|uniref:ABC transporter ATP-binding protein n=1 Tax=Quadrisphaera sp. GCM10027208 TaxID=3273423 RepID=UPI003605E230
MTPDAVRTEQAAPEATDTGTLTVPRAGTGTVVRLRGLTKRYGQSTAVDDVDLTLRRGRIYGLIGKNGAGKTTLMRLIAGLSLPTSGAIELFGSSASAPRQEDLARIGTLIETPTMDGNLTARQNLHLHRLLRGIPDESLDEELLDLVGLTGVGRKRVRDFSLGMRQRLGIAVALVADPELLVLDEPVNGLDPVGVVDVRTLVRQLSFERAITVIVSSHNLPELYQTATDYVIIDRGRIRRTLTQEELESQTQRSLHLAAADPAQLVTVLESALDSPELSVFPDGTVRLRSHLDDTERVLRILVSHDVWPTRFVTEGETLEDYFLSVTGGE